MSGKVNEVTCRLFGGLSQILMGICRRARPLKVRLLAKDEVLIMPRSCRSIDRSISSRGN